MCIQALEIIFPSQNHAFYKFYETLKDITNILYTLWPTKGIATFQVF